MRGQFIRGSGFTFNIDIKTVVVVLLLNYLMNISGLYQITVSGVLLK